MANEKWSKQTNITGWDSTTKLCIITGQNPIYNRTIKPSDLGFANKTNPIFTGNVNMSGATKVYVPTPNGNDAPYQAARQSTLDDRVPKPDSTTENKYLRSSDDGTANWVDPYNNPIFTGNVTAPSMLDLDSIRISNTPSSVSPTGTITVSYSQIITGTGTKFLSFKRGGKITFGGNIGTIDKINSDYSLQIHEFFATQIIGGSYTYTEPTEIKLIDVIETNKTTSDSAIVFNSNIFPYINDNNNGSVGYSLGSAFKVWKDIYATDSTINTSDARYKTPILSLTQDELNASKQLSREIGTYKWLSAIDKKGEAARKHIGMTVQRAIEIMTENNLNPFEYGFIGYDEWEDEYKTIIDIPATDGVEEVSHQELINPAGNRYSFRYTELLAFICRGFEERLTALEQI